VQPGLEEFPTKRTNVFTLPLTERTISRVVAFPPEENFPLHSSLSCTFARSSGLVLLPLRNNHLANLKRQVASVPFFPPPDLKDEPSHFFQKGSLSGFLFRSKDLQRRAVPFFLPLRKCYSPSFFPATDAIRPKSPLTNWPQLCLSPFNHTILPPFNAFLGPPPQKNAPSTHSLPPFSESPEMWRLALISALLRPAPLSFPS